MLHTAESMLDSGVFPTNFWKKEIPSVLWGILIENYMRLTSKNKQMQNDGCQLLTKALQSKSMKNCYISQPHTHFYKSKSPTGTKTVRFRQEHQAQVWQARQNLARNIYIYIVRLSPARSPSASQPTTLVALQNAVECVKTGHWSRQRRPPHPPSILSEV